MIAINKGKCLVYKKSEDFKITDYSTSLNMAQFGYLYKHVEKLPLLELSDGVDVISNTLI